MPLAMKKEMKTKMKILSLVKQSFRSGSRLITLATLGLSLALCACSDDEGSDETGGDNGGGGVVAARIVSVDGNLTFMPADVTVRVNELVEISNSATHNAVEITKEVYDQINTGTYPGGQPERIGFVVDFSETNTVSFSQPGIYYYVCEPHIFPKMIGTITVTE